ncbi:TonB-dependent receptor [Alteromonas oceanisediminis]|uniref:TonB-dependent receptor n=1 Tax=Alteromonas oceanisediminis TaxID=2836180 RepID=UPI001BDA628D|nr:TonB-dependent receptor [Alteromonas oceanisediminis]MBT0586903.1 TonB-dependent receptor [Alteromonas oceanisediminis]
MSTFSISSVIHSPWRFSLIAIALASSLQPSSYATAQEAEAEADIETIMVTARKRTESIYETPTAVTSIGADLIEDANIGNLDDIGKYVPNLNISRYGVGNTGHAAVFIRGIGLQDHIITTDPGVGVYLDGVYLGRQMGANMSLPNIERVEVLRGPQGTLYGRNTLGGAVNVITKQPGDESIANVSVKAGSRGRLAADGYINSPITDDFSVSVSGSYKERDGVGTAVNLANPEKEIGEEQEFSGRIAAKWQVNSALSLQFAVDAVENESGQSPYTIEFTDNRPTGPSIDDGEFYLLTPDLIPANPDDLGTTVAGIESTEYSGWGASFIADYEINRELSAKFIASSRSSEYEGGLDDDASPLNLSEFPETGEADQVSLELQLNGTFGKVDMVSGLYYFNEDGTTESGPWVFSPFNVPNGLLNDGVTPVTTICGFCGDFGFFDLHQETDAYAVYANLSYALSDALSVGGGLRYSKDEKKADALFPSFGGERAFREADFSEVTWDVNAAYQFNNGMNVYGQIQKGYQTGGFPPRPFGGAAQFVSFDETTAINYEVGVKGQITDRVSLLAAVFFTEYTDLALPFSDPQAGGGFVTIVENAGKSEAKGIELESTIDLTDDFIIRTAVGYLDAEITEVDEGVIGIGQGDSPALTPKWTFMFAPSYFIEMDNGGLISLNADYSFRDEMQGQSVFNPNEQLDSRELVGFNIAYESPAGDWTLTAYGENVFNEVYDQGRLAQNGYVGIVRSNDRSEFGLRFSKTFEL